MPIEVPYITIECDICGEETEVEPIETVSGDAWGIILQDGLTDEGWLIEGVG